MTKQTYKPDYWQSSKSKPPIPYQELKAQRDELLEALKSLAKFVQVMVTNDYICPNEQLDNAYKAIARAEGKGE